MFKVFYISVYVAFFLAGCGSAATLPAPVTSSDIKTAQVETIKIAAVGDIMIHDTQISSAHNIVDDSYNFDESFQEVKNYLASADLTIGNLETTLAGKEMEYTGYPRFNTPESLAGTLKNAGFDVLVTANNHAFDRGVPGVIRTIENLQAYGLDHVGTFTSYEEKENILIKEINSIKIALLAYTYGLNGFKLPKDKPYLVNLLDLESAVEDISKAKEAGADIIVVAVHFGTEYQAEPNNYQKEVVRRLFAEGVDVILGSHPHVMQPAHLVEKKLVIYSLGNFISSQKGIERQSGAIFNITIAKDFGSGEVTISEVSYVPIYTQRYIQRGRLNFKVLPIEKTLKLRQYEFLTPSDYDTLQKAWVKTTAHLSSQPDVKVFYEK